MDRDTFNRAIRAFRERTPFQPFTIVTVSGDRYEVDHGGALAFGDGMAVLIAAGSIPVFFDNEGVSEIIGDLSGRGMGKKKRGR